MEKKGLTYKDAGVDVVAGNEIVKQIKSAVESTYRSGVMTELGGFGGGYLLNAAKYEHPVLVASTDGVGTKLKLAFLMDKHDSVGIDLVAMCVNDILAQGAEPLFFLDYIATSKLNPKQVITLVEGIAQGCKQANCALIGGETAEMPGFYAPKEYDMAGFAVGVVEQQRMLPNGNIRAGHVLIGISSSGIHSNGFSLVRNIAFELSGLSVDSWVPELNSTLGVALLTPTRIYVNDVLPLLKVFAIDGIAHITGGGLTGNVPRILPEGLMAEIELSSWPQPFIFKWLQDKGQIGTSEMLRTFNMGIGMVLCVAPQDADQVMHALNNEEKQAYRIGYVTDGDGGVGYHD